MKKIITLLALVFNLSLNAQPGALDTTFNPGIGADRMVYSTAIQSDGKMIIVGAFTSFNNTTRNNIARLNIDGTLDATFDPGSGVDGTVSAVAIQNDGKIIIGGYFYNFNGTARNRIARLNVDGSLDTSFNPGSGSDYSFTATAIQNDGKIIICGAFTTYNGTVRNHIARLNIDGSLDTTFDPGTGANIQIINIAIQSDRKIIICGVFTTYNGIVRNRIARLNIDGSLDTTFNPGTGASQPVNTTAIQPDGKIIIGGVFTSYNGTAQNCIARLNTDGSLDTTFNIGSGAYGYLTTAALQNDGKIIIGGAFTAYNGTARKYIARLNIDGSLDASFNPAGSGLNNYVLALVIQSDEKIFIGGRFTDYNGTSRNYIARVWGGTVSGVGIEDINTADLVFRMYPNPVAKLLTIETDVKDEVKIEVVEMSGKIVLSTFMVEKKTLDVSKLTPSIYLVKLIRKEGSVEKLFVKTGQ